MMSWSLGPAHSPTGAALLFNEDMKMIDAFADALTAQLSNEFFAGGIALAVVGGLTALLIRCWQTVVGWLKSRFVWEVTIKEHDELFDEVVGWLTHRPEMRGCRSVEAKSKVNGVAFRPGPGPHVLRVDGTIMRVWRHEVESRSRSRCPGPEQLHIQSFARSPVPLCRTLDSVRADYGAEADNRVRVYVAESDDWRFLARITPRPLDSLILPPGLAESIVADARAFLGSEAWYVQRGIPWRRGYLFHGPPGTGKSSLAKAIAGTLGLSIYLLNLSSAKSEDAALTSLLANVDQGILLLEDIDAVFHGRGQGTDSTGVTFSGLLNALDGVAAAESGRILLMTTNHPERLDPALVRPGRIDVATEIGLAGPDEFRRLFLRFFPEEAQLAQAFAAALNDQRLPLAAVQGLLLETIDEPEQAVRNAAKLRSGMLDKGRVAA